MVNDPIIGPYFVGWGGIGGVPLGSHDIASPHLLGAVASLEVVLVLLLSRWMHHRCTKGPTGEKGQVSKNI